MPPRETERPPCSVPDCERLAMVRGWCPLHYNRWLRTGDPGDAKPHVNGEPHGRSATVEYTIWTGMKSRCFDPKTVGFKNWGGRGITICDRWRDSFAAFYEDMGERPERRSIDRIDNDGNYSCGKCEHCERMGWLANCRWATASEQLRNRRPWRKAA